VDAAKGAASVQPQVGQSTPLLLQMARSFALCVAGDTAQKRQYTDQALEALRAATREDYKDAVALQTDPDLASIRQEAAFQSVIDKVKSR